VRSTRFRHRLVVACAAALLASTPAAAPAEDHDANEKAARRHDVLQQRMLNDPEIMRRVQTLRDDPQVQAILADPAIAAALERGDLSALLADPKIQRLAKDPAVQSITRQVAE
jgi:hypothetical protein